MFAIQETQQTHLWHELVPCGPIPTAQDPDGVYPYTSYCETAKRPGLKAVRMVSIENDRIRAVICPDLGGKVYSLCLKESGKEALHVIPVVRPVRILPRQCFIGGGIEVSFPISHTPVQISSVLYRVMERDDRIYVYCGERELRFGMHWTVEYSLGEGDDYLTQRTFFFNPTNGSHPWMSWSNASVPARADTEFHFPSGPVLYHGGVMKVIDWDREGPRRQGDMRRMAGFFWKEPDCSAFGAFTPSLGCGLYHVADPALTPGIKLWTDGFGPHEAWVNQFSLDGSQCLEIQAGPLMDQSIKATLPPGGRHHHVEFWIPSAEALDIRAIPLPEPTLPPPDEIPWFSWARAEEVELWQALAEAANKRNIARLPPAPDWTRCQWAPSGMEDLGEVLDWVVANTDGTVRKEWLAHLGAWHAGRDEMEPAIDKLLESGQDWALALAGRLYRRCRNDIPASIECFHSIQSELFALHPQVVVERDLSLAGLGPEGFEERAKWFEKCSGIGDEWVIERRAALLVDQGKFSEAKSLLESTDFQLVHQRYARTNLWGKIKSELLLEAPDPPNWLGEDDLAEFGAYREYQEDEI